MTKMNHQEFAEYCNTNVQTISVYISRGHLLQDALKQIDINHQKSKRFYKNRIKLDKKKNTKPAAEVTSEIAKWQAKKVVADSRKSEYEAELRKIKLQQAMGLLVPVQVMERILKHNVREIFIKYEQELLNLASVENDKAGGTRAILGELNDAMRIELERQISLASEDVEKNVNIAIESYGSR